MRFGSAKLRLKISNARTFPTIFLRKGNGICKLNQLFYIPLEYLVITSVTYKEMRIEELKCVSEFSMNFF